MPKRTRSVRSALENLGGWAKKLKGGRHQPTKENIAPGCSSQPVIPSRHEGIKGSTTLKISSAVAHSAGRVPARAALSPRPLANDAIALLHPATACEGSADERPRDSTRESLDAAWGGDGMPADELNLQGESTEELSGEDTGSDDGSYISQSDRLPPAGGGTYKSTEGYEHFEMHAQALCGSGMNRLPQSQQLNVNHIIMGDEDSVAPA
ncbi:hypothetical protein PAXRUDRAFT_19906, partial [Paxillus rubicundulus Ve08.2h10]